MDISNKSNSKNIVKVKYLLLISIYSCGHLGNDRFLLRKKENAVSETCSNNSSKCQSTNYIDSKRDESRINSYDQRSQISQFASDDSISNPYPDCYDSRNVGLSISKKISDHLYEMKGDGRITPPLALLKTKKAVYDTPGLPAGLSMKRIDNKRVVLQNGFFSEIPVLEECNFDESQIRRHNNPYISWPRSIANPQMD